MPYKISSFVSPFSSYSQFSSAQLLSCVWLFVTPWTAAGQASLSIANSQSLLRFMSIELVMLSNHLVICCPSPPTLNPSPNQSFFPWVSSLHQVDNYWSFSFSISLSNEYLGLISFRIGWFDLLAVQETLKNLLHHQNSKASIRCSAFFMVQLSHPNMTTEKP